MLNPFIDQCKTHKRLQKCKFVSVLFLPSYRKEKGRWPGCHLKVSRWISRFTTTIWIDRSFRKFWVHFCRVFSFSNLHLLRRNHDKQRCWMDLWRKKTVYMFLWKENHNVSFIAWYLSLNMKWWSHVAVVARISATTIWNSTSHSGTFLVKDKHVFFNINDCWRFRGIGLKHSWRQHIKDTSKWDFQLFLSTATASIGSVTCKRTLITGPKYWWRGPLILLFGNISLFASSKMMQ